MNKVNYYDNHNQPSYLDNYYAIIYSLLCLDDGYKIITKSNFNEKENIRELLFVDKKYQNDNVDYETSSKIFYIIIKEKPDDVEFEEYCYEALDYNEELIFNGKSLNKKNEKIIKYGIAIYKKNVMRFGKSLNLRMIQEFFEKPVNREKLRNDSFDGLEVSKNRKNMRDFHKYPVIYLNFKDEDSNNYADAIEHLKNKISDLFINQRENVDFKILDKNEQTKWKEIEDKKEDEIDLKESIRFLCDCLKKFYKRKCIVLIDEYDKALMNSFEKKYYDEMYSIIKSLFSNTFKGNGNLYFGIITGCLPLEFSSFYSGFNNYQKCSFLKDQYFNDCYGFTENGLNKILSDFGITHTDNQRDMIRKKYDGYICHTNGQENELLFTRNFLSLLYGNIIILNVFNEFIFENKYYEDEILLLLLYSGYLTLLDEKEYKENIF
ncbi:hypothetical protein BCR36DRAFT_397834 [Piromyces finnis]|uniref:AAA-ATPase-like domain-containing protein n=1 Tax=Piromyces finnis TaxID=1754191 RepID=A0A1Y1V7G7_9FUNG|nr:hypothetical protein BCR36DRAFT_397834 [Piromyces finnis]|eukprot:ORX49207.1 hypothetical protein BCR36DRAFT_397834 [Piromyces finnis]